MSFFGKAEFPLLGWYEVKLLFHQSDNIMKLKDKTALREIYPIF